jgi:hypothetical protein
VCLKQAQAQHCYAYSSVDYDDASGVVHGYAETEPDYSLQPYYTAVAQATLKDENGNQLNHSQAQASYGAATAYVEANGNDTVEYTVTGVHYFFLNQSQCDPQYGCGGGLEYIDYYNFESFSGQDIDVPAYYDFFGPGPEILGDIPDIILGGTYASVVADQTPTSLQLMEGPLITHMGDSITDCSGRLIASGAYGYSRNLQYYLLDQYGRVINKSGFTAIEEVYKVSSNPPTTPPDHYEKSAAINGGWFCDVQALYTAAPGPGPGQYFKAKQYLNVTNPGHGWALRVNCLDLEYNDVYITETNSEATCQ